MTFSRVADEDGTDTATAGRDVDATDPEDTGTIENVVDDVDLDAKVDGTDADSTRASKLTNPTRSRQTS